MTTRRDEEEDDDDDDGEIAAAAAATPSTRSASLPTTIVNLCNCAVGAGILSIPDGVRECGAALGAVLVLVAASLTIFTVDVIVKHGERSNADSYQALVLRAFGPEFAHVVGVALMLFAFGSCVAYVVIVVDAVDAATNGFPGLSRMLRRRLPLPPFAQPTGRVGVVTFASVFALLPLSLLRRTKSLAPASALAVVALAFTATVVVVDAGEKLIRGGDEGEGGGDVVVAWKLGAGVVRALPVFVFAFQVHVQVLSVFAEFRDDPRDDDDDDGGENENENENENGDDDARPPLAPMDADDAFPGFATPRSSLSPSSSIGSLVSSPSGRRGAGAGAGAGGANVFGADADGDVVIAASKSKSKPKSNRRAAFERAVAISTVIALVGYVAVGEFAYYAHPDVESNMLESYDEKNTWIITCKLFMGVNAIGSYAMNHFSHRAALDDTLCAMFGWTKRAAGMAPLGRHVSQTIAFVFATGVVASLVSDLGAVFTVVGSTAAVLVIFVVPGLLCARPAWSVVVARRRAGARRRGGGEGGEERGGSAPRRLRTKGANGALSSFTASSHEEMRAALLPGGGAALGDDVDEETGGGGGGVPTLTREALFEAAAGFGLLLLGAFISISNVWLIVAEGRGAAPH